MSGQDGGERSDRCDASVGNHPPATTGDNNIPRLSIASHLRNDVLCPIDRVANCSCSFILLYACTGIHGLYQYHVCKSIEEEYLGFNIIIP